uniref:Uncharacterized protein n=1 Tax=Manihot esculenta TaxID=3983 RepID=A0A2C9WPZ4_MANES
MTCYLLSLSVTYSQLQQLLETHFPQLTNFPATSLEVSLFQLVHYLEIQVYDQ